MACGATHISILDKKYMEAATTMEDRQNKIEAVNDEMERDLVVSGRNVGCFPNLRSGLTLVP